jgi:hypothetical protein
MYLKKTKSRKRDKLKRTKSKFKYIKRLYSIKRGGANISENDIISDEAIHLYIGDIKMDEKPGNNLDTATSANFTIPVSGTSTPVSDIPNSFSGTSTPVSGISEKDIPPPSKFNIDEFMELLNILYNNADKASKKATRYANNSRVLQKMTEYLKVFAKHSTQLVSVINKNMVKIKNLSITNDQFNQLGPNVFTNKDSNSWIIILKNILVDLFVSIIESKYVFTLTPEDYQDIESAKRFSIDFNEPRIEEIKIVNTEIIKRTLNNINKPTYNYTLPILFENIDKPLSVGKDKSVLQHTTLDICIIELLFDLLYQCNSQDKQIQIIKNDLSNLQYVMNKMNEMVQKDLLNAQNNDESSKETSSDVYTSTSTSTSNSEITEFLVKINLLKYKDTLIKEGFDKIEKLTDENQLDDDMLKDAIKMSKLDIKKFRDAVNIYKSSNPSIVKNNTNTSKRITKLSCKIKNGEVCCNQKL